MQLKTHSGITKYFGFLYIGLTWSTFLLCMAIHPINTAEPGSQYGYYESTRLIFGVGASLVAIIYYLFCKNLDSYWGRSSLFALLGGIPFALTGWVPYQPYARDFILDFHNLCVVLSVILYAVPIYFIGYKKVHRQIAKVSRVLFYTIVVIAIFSLLARYYDLWILYVQVLTFTVFHVWIFMVSLLLIQHKPVADGHTGKL